MRRRQHMQVRSPPTWDSISERTHDESTQNEKYKNTLYIK